MVRSDPKNLQVLFEDNHLIVVNKRAGDIVQGDKTGDTPLSETVKAYIKKKYQKPGDVYLGVVHRIDRPVSGVVLFARTSKALARLNAMFQKREVEKTYWAIVKNKPSAERGKLTDWLYKVEKQNKSYVTATSRPDAKKAVLDYNLLASSDSYFLLEVSPETGRHHQIRVQLAAMGCPIKGDLKYGFDRSNEDGSICLHARMLKINHPVGNAPLEFTAPVPSDKLWQWFERGQENSL